MARLLAVAATDDEAEQIARNGVGDRCLRPRCRGLSMGLTPTARWPSASRATCLIRIIWGSPARVRDELAACPVMRLRYLMIAPLSHGRSCASRRRCCQLCERRRGVAPWRGRHRSAHRRPGARWSAAHPEHGERQQLRDLEDEDLVAPPVVDADADQGDDHARHHRPEEAPVEGADRACGR